MKNLDNQSYLQLKSIVRDSNIPANEKSKLFHRLHDAYHFGQDVDLKMRIKHPKIYEYWKSKQQ